MQPQITRRGQITRIERERLNELTEQVIGLAMSVHRELGPGFTEKIYEEALAYELKEKGLDFRRQLKVAIDYKGKLLGEQRVDLLVEDRVIVELKAVREINEIHEAQLISYLKAADKRVGLVLNFAERSLGIRRVVNRF